MKKIIIPVILFVIIIIGVSCFMFYSKTKNVEEVTNENVVDTKTNIETDNNVTKSSEDKINEIENSNELTNSSAIKESKSEEKKEEKKSEGNKNNNIKQNTTVVEEPKSEDKKTAWDELGLSEYDYYHKPMWNWQRIDFSIDEYKTEQKLDFDIEADGGIKVENSQKLIQAGVDIIVAGTAILESNDYAETIKKLR